MQDKTQCTSARAYDAVVDDKIVLAQLLCHFAAHGGHHCLDARVHCCALLFLRVSLPRTTTAPRISSLPPAWHTDSPRLLFPPGHNKLHALSATFWAERMSSRSRDSTCRRSFVGLPSARTGPAAPSRLAGGGQRLQRHEVLFELVALRPQLLPALSSAPLPRT